MPSTSNIPRCQISISTRFFTFSYSHTPHGLLASTVHNHHPHQQHRFSRINNCPNLAFRKTTSFRFQMATKKRAHVCNQEEEEKKMEQFFALLRNFHEALNRRKEELRQQQKDAKIRKKESSWVPAFEWADFNEEIEFQRPAPCNDRDGKIKQEERDHDGLDLSLTL
ncbi:hypothetical protein GQ457_01G051160 [Hibiscus cannabinus]